MEKETIETTKEKSFKSKQWNNFIKINLKLIIVLGIICGFFIIIANFEYLNHSISYHVAILKGLF